MWWTTKTKQPGTFAVDRVKRSTEHLPVCRTHEAVKRMLASPIESCSDYHGTVVADIRYQPLLAAVHTAFSQHYPLVLTPDAVWITIAQGVAQHMAIHGERLRDRFVAHQGRLDLTFECRDWVENSPENPWPEAFASWAGQIREQVGHQLHDALVCDFSTTGLVERAASQIVLMDIFERYFHYRAVCICGIPTVTLEGTTEDWQCLANKVVRLKDFDLDWWLDHLYPICEEFVRASRGEVNREHWQNICKLRNDYGGDVINGWVAKLFPYLRAFVTGPCNRRNPIFETGEGFQTFVAPPGLSRVPFTWKNLTTGRDRAMEAVGGLVGVTQHLDTRALRPAVGWAVREAEKMDTLLTRLTADHTTFPAVGIEKQLRLPEDLCKLYHRTGGAELFGRGTAAAFRIVPPDQIEPLDWGEPASDLNGYGPDGRNWHRFAWLSGGTWLAINLGTNKSNAPYWDNRRLRELEESVGYEIFAPICHGSTTTQGQAGQNPVVAFSFTELLERLLASGGKPFWPDPQSAVYGDADQYTNRRVFKLARRNDNDATR
jgi:hypothetical protein